MPCSPAQLAANRKNSLLSTGPKTPAGKLQSRANSLKHGLTGEGIVIPEDDLAELDRRADAFEAELRPSGDVGRFLVRRTAALSVRLDRSVRNELAAVAQRVRNADREHVDGRLAEAEYMLGWLAAEPLTYSRRLRETPEGLDLMIREWERLAADLVDPATAEWDVSQFGQAANLTGDRLEGHHVTRWRALSRAFWNDRHLLDLGEGDGLDAAALKIYAAGQLATLIDVELAEVRALRAAIDERTIALDRAGAPDRALFDPSKEATLARKYEAAAERGMYRALKEFREVEAEAAACPTPDPSAPSSPTNDEPGSELASSGTEVEGPAAPPDPAPRVAVLSPPATPVRSAPISHSFFNVSGDGPMSVGRGHA